ncbi:MAG: Re/Si-specific NAD(P)(+) transhydrogenase subunit alpha [Planctomycetota bacterium]|nr:Re/Si-specific NAD(P)(+) transhydrogenase subunit alpha [Planctomycetota bacterium]
MLVGIVKESLSGERRVALTPHVLGNLTKIGLEVMLESGVGEEAGFPDSEYTELGAKVALSRSEVFSQADIICQVRTIGANPEAGASDLDLMRRDQVFVGHCEPLTDVGPITTLAKTGVITFAMELMPRITRAQSMDVLSSQATIGGYKAVLLAAHTLPKMFPMMMTAAGTNAPAKVFIVGAGVAGLQAIASAKRLGAVVTAYDVRSAVKEQVESLGGKFLEIELDAGESEDKGGYAKAMGEEFLKKQREAMTTAVAESDVVITTAAVPGKKAPVLITAAMIEGMRPGSVIIDLAAERGGNCEPTRSGETVKHGGATIIGPSNLPATVPFHASQMYAKNVATFLKEITNEGELNLDLENEVIKGTMLTRGGEIVHAFAREVFGLDPLEPETASSDSSGGETEGSKD